MVLTCVDPVRKYKPHKSIRLIILRRVYASACQKHSNLILTRPHGVPLMLKLYDQEHDMSQDLM